MIAFDAASSGSTTGTVLTVSHTIGAGSNRLLLVGQGVRSSDNTVISMTYAGINMSLLRDAIPNSGTMRLYYLVNPPVGTADIVSTVDQSRNHVMANASYNGVDQTAIFDATGTDTTGASGVSSYSKSLTTTIDNDWIVAVGVDNTEVQTASSGTTQRAAAGGNMRIGFYDNNVALTPVGTYTIGFDLAGIQTAGIIATTLIRAVTFVPQVMGIV